MSEHKGFKVGDKVRVTKKANWGSLEVGYVGQITKISPKGCCLIDDASCGWILGPSGGDIELVNEGREEVEKAIKVFEKHDIRRFRVSENTYTYTTDSGGTLRTPEDLLDHLFPPSDPHAEEREAIEKEMRELSQRQEELADRVAKLGGES